MKMRLLLFLLCTYASLTESADSPEQNQNYTDAPKYNDLKTYHPNKPRDSCCEDRLYLKQETPSSLYVQFVFPPCCISKEEVVESFYKKLRFARIKPIEIDSADELSLNQLFLRIHLDYLDRLKLSETTNQPILPYVAPYFAQAVFMMNTKKHGLIMTGANFRRFGFDTGNSEMGDANRAVIDEAILAYIKENFGE